MWNEYIKINILSFFKEYYSLMGDCRSAFILLLQSAYARCPSR